MKKFMMIGCLSLIASSAVFPACGAMLCSGQSPETVVELASGVRTAAPTERIQYSTAWVDGAASDVTAVVEVNGEALNSAIGSGYVDWTSMSNGIFVLTHKVMSSGVQVGETLTATFVVDTLKAADPVFSPARGTIFDTSLTVSILCSTDGAMIHYTTDGSEPTIESPVYRRFRITDKTTVKAIAVKDGWLSSNVVTAEYALGQCSDPVIAPRDGATFEWEGEQVSISWQGEDGVLRYTTDGSDPTLESPVYDGPFTISDTTVVKAKAFGNQFFDSAIVTANITRIWKDVAMPQIESTNSFTGSKTKVVISCATEGATIRYTLDGSTPDSNSDVYAGPFCVTDSCTVKAYAVKYDYRDSTVATQEIVKVWGIGDTMGKPDHGFTTDGAGGVGWMRVVDATAPTGEAMKSGVITDNQESVLETKVMGPGTLTFSWRTSCEDSGGQYDWDHAEFAVDGTVLLWRDGINSWTNESVRINGGGEHTVTWTYKKDDVESDGDDAAYVAGYAWTSDYTETKTTEVPVPYAWLIAHDPGVVDEYDAYEASAKATAVNGHKVWECYVLGLDPQGVEAFRITTFQMKADGTPDLNSIAFTPTQAEWNVPGAQAVLKGAATLDGEWQMVTEENKAGFRFFKVVVELP